MARKFRLDCSEVRSHLPGFLNESLDGSDAQQMRSHFEKCSDCRMILLSALDTFRLFFPEKRTPKFLHRSHAA